MLRTRQNHEEEHDEIDTSSYQCTVRTIGAYSMFGVQAMAAPRWAWTHLYIAKQKVKEKESKPSLYVFPQNSFVVYFTSNSVRQRTLETPEKSKEHPNLQMKRKRTTEQKKTRQLKTRCATTVTVDVLIFTSRHHATWIGGWAGTYYAAVTALAALARTG